jgi:hypothetical protein
MAPTTVTFAHFQISFQTIPHKMPEMNIPCVMLLNEHAVLLLLQDDDSYARSMNEEQYCDATTMMTIITHLNIIMKKEKLAAR